MTNDDIRALSATAVFTFGDGREVRMRKVSVQALIDATEALKRRIVQRAVAGLGEDATPADRAAVARQAALDTERDASLIDLETPDAMLEILWVCAKPENPELTRAGLGEMITLEEVAGLGQFIRSELMGLGSEGDDPNAAAVTAAGQQ